MEVGDTFQFRYNNAPNKAIFFGYYSDYINNHGTIG